MPSVRKARFADILVICLVSGSAGQTFILMPILLGTLADGRGYDPALLGSIAAITAAGGLITGLSSPLWLARFPIRRLAVGLVLAVVAGLLLMALFARSTMGVMLGMGFHGIAAGALYTLMFGAVSLYDAPERVLGWKLGTEGLPALAFLPFISAFVVPRYGTNGVIVAMALSALVLGAAAMALPAVRVQADAPVEEAGSGSMELVLLGLAVGAAFTCWMGINALWTFMERVGADHGLTIAATGIVLTLGWLFASAGSLAAGALGNRLGGRVPYIVSTILTLGSLVIFLDPSALGFGIGANVYLISASFSMVFAIALISRINTQARFAGLGAVALQAAGVAGPMAGGLSYEHLGSGGIFGFAGVCAVAALSLYLVADIRSARRIAGNAYSQ